MRGAGARVRCNGAVDKRSVSRLFKALAEFFERLAGEDAGFLVAHSEGIAKLLEHAVSEIEKMSVAWDALTSEQKAAAEADSVRWKRSRRHEEGEIAPVKVVPNLARLLERKGGKLRLGGYVYYRSGRWVLRFPRGGGE